LKRFLEDVDILIDNLIILFAIFFLNKKNWMLHNTVEGGMLNGKCFTVFATKEYIVNNKSDLKICNCVLEVERQKVL
jgi:hypothetical protein